MIKHKVAQVVYLDMGETVKFNVHDNPMSLYNNEGNLENMHVEKIVATYQSEDSVKLDHHINDGRTITIQVSADEVRNADSIVPKDEAAYHNIFE